MSAKRRKALEKLEFKWVKKRIDFVPRGLISVDDRYAAIDAFRRQHGHADIDVAYGVEGTFKQCMVAYICTYCGERLLGDAKKWLHHRDMHMNELTPADRGELGLGNFIRNARQRARANKLDKDVYSKLKELGVKVDAGPKRGRPAKISFAQRVEALETFKKIFGHVNVPNRFTGLGTCHGCHKAIRENEPYFVIVSRGVCFHAECLKCGRCDEVITLDENCSKVGWGFAVETRLVGSKTKMINKMLPRCNSSNCRHGFINSIVHELDVKTEMPRVPRGMEGLGTWLKKQREDFANGKVDNDKVEVLEGLGIVWKLRTFTFEERVEALQEFKEREGHLFVPRRYSGPGASTSLGRWCSDQRTLSKPVYFRLLTGKRILTILLPEEQQKRLDEIGFEWNGVDKPDNKEGEEEEEGGSGDEYDDGLMFYWLEHMPDFLLKAALLKHHKNNTVLRDCFSKWVDSFRTWITSQGGEWPRDDLYWREIDKLIEPACNWERLETKPNLETLDDMKEFLLSGMRIQEEEEEEEEEEKEKEKEPRKKSAWELMCEAFGE
jgi:hypothetical protein